MTVIIKTFGLMIYEIINLYKYINNIRNPIMAQYIKE